MPLDAYYLCGAGKGTVALIDASAVTERTDDGDLWHLLGQRDWNVVGLPMARRRVRQKFDADFFRVLPPLLAEPFRRIWPGWLPFVVTALDAPVATLAAELLGPCGCGGGVDLLVEASREHDMRLLPLQRNPFVDGARTGFGGSIVLHALRTAGVRDATHATLALWRKDRKSIAEFATRVADAWWREWAARIPPTIDISEPQRAYGALASAFHACLLEQEVRGRREVVADHSVDFPLLAA